jgi:hypothetical protein
MLYDCFTNIVPQQWIWAATWYAMYTFIYLFKTCLQVHSYGLHIGFCFKTIQTCFAALPFSPGMVMPQGS